MNDDGHSSETCNFNECNAVNPQVPCPFVRDDMKTYGPNAESIAMYDPSKRLQWNIDKNYHQTRSHEWRVLDTTLETYEFYCVFCRAREFEPRDTAK